MSSAAQPARLRRLSPDRTQNFILAEIVKAASPNPAVLLEVVNRLNIQPRWEDISLPQGTTAVQWTLFGPRGFASRVRLPIRR